MLEVMPKSTPNRFVCPSLITMSSSFIFLQRVSKSFWFPPIIAVSSFRSPVEGSPPLSALGAFSYGLRALLAAAHPTPPAPVAWTLPRPLRHQLNSWEWVPSEEDAQAWSTSDAQGRHLSASRGLSTIEVVCVVSVSRWVCGGRPRKGQGPVVTDDELLSSPGHLDEFGCFYTYCCVSV